MARVIERIFDFLQVLSRSEEKTTMKVKHFEEVCKNGKLHKNVHFPLIGQKKEDGVYALVTRVGSEIRIYNRTGRLMTNVDHLVAGLKWVLVSNGVYIAELVNGQCSLEMLSGIVNPLRTEPLDEQQTKLLGSMKLKFHDYLTLSEFAAGQSDATYEMRYNDLKGKHMYQTNYFSVLPITYLYSIEQVESMALSHINMGHEGIVVKCADAIWEAGHKGWRMMKIVRQVDYDLMCIDMEDGKGKAAGTVANLFFRWRDGNIKCSSGKGWTAEKLLELYRTNGAVGKVFRVKGLQDSSKGKIRLPKFCEIRHDKVDADF